MYPQLLSVLRVPHCPSPSHMEPMGTAPAVHDAQGPDDRFLERCKAWATALVRALDRCPAAALHELQAHFCRRAEEEEEETPAAPPLAAKRARNAK